MRHKAVVLITGSSGEIGQGLITALAEEHEVVALDRSPAPAALATQCRASVVGDILDRALVERLFSEHDVSAVFHLAALLSTRSEEAPELAQEVNVTGTLNLLRLAHEQAAKLGESVKFLFPSSIAAYGVGSLSKKRAKGRIGESECLEPTTMYGCNKLTCEHLGRYYARHYRRLPGDLAPGVDFRSIRFPGLISATTVPSGGTSDYAPEMLHAAAQRKAYACFVREDTRIPFMAMPDAVDALTGLFGAPASALSTHVYNIAAFSPSAGEFAGLVKKAFPGADITFAPDPRRQAIVDSWPEDIDDTLAHREWGFKSVYDLESAMNDYLLPNIRARYGPG